MERSHAFARNHRAPMPFGNRAKPPASPPTVRRRVPITAARSPSPILNERTAGSGFARDRAERPQLGRLPNDRSGEDDRPLLAQPDDHRRGRHRPELVGSELAPIGLGPRPMASNGWRAELRPSPSVGATAAKAIRIAHFMKTCCDVCGLSLLPAHSGEGLLRPKHDRAGAPRGA